MIRLKVFPSSFLLLVALVYISVCVSTVMRDLSSALVALNATVAVERLRSRQSQSESGCSSTVVTQVLNPESAPPRSGKKMMTQK